MWSYSLFVSFFDVLKIDLYLSQDWGFVTFAWFDVGLNSNGEGEHELCGVNLLEIDCFVRLFFLDATMALLSIMW